MDEQTPHIQVDITPFFCVAVAHNPKTYSLINEFYNKDAEKYYQYAVQSPYYNTEPITDGTPQQIEYARKILGIFLCLVQDLDKQCYNFIITLYKKAFSYCYQLLQTFEEIDFIKIVPKIFKKIADKPAWEKDILVIDYAVLIIFGASLLEKNIVQNELYREILKNLHLQSLHNQKARTIRISFEILKQYKKESKEFRQMLESKVPDLKYCEFIGSSDYYNELFAFLNDLEDISIEEILSDTITLQDVDMIYEFVYTVRQLHKQPTENLTQEQLEQISREIKALLYYLPLVRMYKKFKDFYLNNITKIYSYNNLEKQYLSLQTSFNILQKEKQQLLQQIDNLTKHIQYLKKELEQYQEDLKELSELRRVVFEESNIETKSEEINIELTEKELNKLKDKKIVLIGGQQKWHNLFKPYIPNGIFIEWDRVNYDENFVFNNADLIVINTKMLTHSAYYKAINVAKKMHIPWILINNTNTQLVLQKILKYI